MVFFSHPFTPGVLHLSFLHPHCLQTYLWRTSLSGRRRTSGPGP